jgi:hypothetical protein
VTHELSFQSPELFNRGGDPFGDGLCACLLGQVAESHDEGNLVISFLTRDLPYSVWRLAVGVNPLDVIEMRLAASGCGWRITRAAGRRPPPAGVSDG